MSKIIFIYLNTDRMCCCPVRVTISPLFPFLIKLRHTIKQYFLGFPTSLRGIFNIIICSQKILFLLKHDFRNILTTNKIDAFITGRIVCGNLFALDGINTGSIHMG